MEETKEEEIGMSKKLNIMSLSIDSDMQDKIKECAKKRKVSVSKLIRDMAEKYLINEEDVIPVNLKVPIKLKGDPENLQKWLELRVGAIVKALSA